MGKLRHSIQKEEKKNSGDGKKTLLELGFESASGCLCPPARSDTPAGASTSTAPPAAVSSQFPVPQVQFQPRPTTARNLVELGS